MIFIDSNIPMYAGGIASLKKERSLLFLTKIYNAEIDGASSAEVLQEILHRYRALHQFEEGLLIYDAFRAMAIRWLDVVCDDADHAKELILQHPSLSSRDAIHLAVMQRNGIKKIVTYDQGFLGIPGITVYIPQ